MTYSNPLGIFSATQLEKLQKGNLKSLKKEILLHFQLSDEATIERNGKKYDKNQILEIFDDLQENLDLHFKIFNNQPLKEFLENKDFHFFKDTTAKYSVQHDIVYRDQIDTHIANQLNIVTADLVNNVTLTNAARLQLILEYTKEMNSTLQDKAYNKAYIELKAHVERLSIDYHSPFLSNNNLTLNRELHELINPLFYNYFKYLPGAFQDIGFGYAVWCHNDVVNVVFKREPNYTLFAKKDLKTIAKAMEIGCGVTQSEAFRQNTKEVKSYLKTGGFTSQRQTRQQTSERPKTSQRTQAKSRQTSYETDNTTSPWSAIKIVLITLFVLFKIVVIADRCNRKDPTSYKLDQRYTGQKYNSRTYAQESKEYHQKVNKKRARKAKEAIHAQYAGDDKLLWNPKLLRSEEANNVIELDYEVDIFPSNYLDFRSLIPRDISQKYKSKTKDFVIKFKSKDFPGRSQSHRFRVSITEKGFIKGTVVLDAKKSDRSDKFALTIKRLLKKKKLKGSITKYSSGSNGEILKVLFEIRDDLELEPQKEESGKVPSFAEAKFDKWNDFSISNIADQQHNAIDQKYKNIILNNFNQIAYKVFKQGNYYTIQTMATYTPNSLITNFYKMSDIRETKCNVRLDYVSNEDEIAILSLYGENIYIRYFVSNETNRIIGMNMVVGNGDVRKGVEVIEVFFE